ncbi:MAG: diguanylate cyclase [Chloroflexi bacterium]|nr:diguanylate cyclase [Chloroflexota bacterium]
MNIYSTFPLIATIAYMVLLGTMFNSRPWQSRHKLFALFLVAAMSWSLVDYLFRSDFFPQDRLLLLQITLVMFGGMAVQFHVFSSSFFAPGESRWLVFAYISLAVMTAAAMLGWATGDLDVGGEKLYPRYGIGIIFFAIPLLTLAGRNIYIFWRKLRILDNPVQYNQIVSLMLGIGVLVVFGITALLPWGREVPISHFGNLINAVILSYATIRHQLVDIRFVIRRGLAWAALWVIGGVIYWLSLVTLHAVFPFKLDLPGTFVATVVAIFVIYLVFRLRDVLFAGVNKAIQGRSYDHRQKLTFFARNIHTIFTLKGQGRELLRLVTRAIGCSKAYLLFPETGSSDFVVKLAEPEAGNPLSSLRLEWQNPIVEYLKEKRKPVTRMALATLPEFRSLWAREKEQIESNNLEIFMPLVSRASLVGILVLDKKQSGRYTLEDFGLLEEVTDRVAVSMEKEYLREQSRERENDLSIINRSASIMTSSLDVRMTYDSFINELKQVVDASWAAITLLEEKDIYFLAISSEIGSAWQMGERIPRTGTATEWVTSHGTPLIESDLSQESQFVTGRFHVERGVRSIIYLPLIVKNEAIGALLVASRNPNAYTQRYTRLLEELASQIAMPIANSRLYAKAEQMARTDGLTGLLNRRSLDETLNNEISRHSRYGGVFSLTILDLDSFKAFNDSYGHLAGDKLLKQIGQIIRTSIRSSDQGFRYGGDEFAIVLPQTNTEAAVAVAERIRNRLISDTKDGFSPTTASIGIASWPADGVGITEIIAASDAALYQAKRSGGNQCCTPTTKLTAEEVTGNNGSNKDSEILSNIYALAATVDARDHYTRSHSKRVNQYAIAIAEALNLEPLEINRLSTCALLHDVGKIGISDEILNKTDKLTQDDWEAIKTHPQLGATIASHTRHLAPCIPGILYHHERYDGSGYPKGLKGGEIPLEARILAIADSFAAMTSERAYSTTMSFEDAVEEIKSGAGTQFDPGLVEIFLSIMQADRTVKAGRNKT